MCFVFYDGLFCKGMRAVALVQRFKKGIKKKLRRKKKVVEDEEKKT